VYEVNDEVCAVNEDCESFMKRCKPIQDSNVLSKALSTKRDYSDGW